MESLLCESVTESHEKAVSCVDYVQIFFFELQVYLLSFSMPLFYAEMCTQNSDKLHVYSDSIQLDSIHCKSCTVKKKKPLLLKFSHLIITPFNQVYIYKFICKFGLTILFSIF